MSVFQNSTVVQVEGIRCYAPELAYKNSHYSESGFEALYASEAGSFWFRARQRIIEFLVKKYMQVPTAAFLEVGCGTGFVLQGLSQLGFLRLMGAEVHLAGLKWARKRLSGVELIQMDATQMPFSGEFDGVGAFDVIEHIEKDTLALENFYHALKPGGYLFLTVPQHMFLWSPADDAGLHKRRYSRRELVEKLHRTGFEVRFISSFVFLLFPGMYLSRKIGSKKKPEDSMGACELKLPRLLDRVADGLMRLEEILLFAGVSLPWGGSLVVAAQKRLL